jgi:hypothetical protein
MTEALLTEPEVADHLLVSLACLLRWHLERRGAWFKKLSPSYGYLVVPPTMGNGAVGLQRLPVPIVMWNPLKIHHSVPLRLFGPATLEVAGEQASILVCYGQLLSWLILQSAVERPTLIVGLADDNWAHGTPIPAAQQAAVAAWARLFRLPKLWALNL